jgi:hypothetical protein
LRKEVMKTTRTATVTIPLKFLPPSRKFFGVVNAGQSPAMLAEARREEEIARLNRKLAIEQRADQIQREILQERKRRALRG